MSFVVCSKLLPSALALTLAVALSGPLAHAAPPPPPSPPQPRVGDRPAAPATLTLAALLDAFRAAPGIEARFTEERHIGLLAAPLETSGTLYFAPPAQLARYTDPPHASVLLLDAKQLRMRSGTTWETVDLDAKPVVRHFVDSFATLLRGDGATLHHLYDATFTPGPPGPPGAADAWDLALVPKLAPLSRVFARLEFSGAGLRVHTMRVLEVAGDASVTTFTEVNPNRTFSAAERARLFAPSEGRP